jgi:hypothetical protein
MKRYDVSEIGLALLLGSLMGFVPLVMMKLAPTDHVLINALKFLSAFTMLPGLAVGMVAAEGKIDDINLWVAAVVDFAFYFWLSRTVLRLLERRKTQPHSKQPSSQ